MNHCVHANILTSLIVSLLYGSGNGLAGRKGMHILNLDTYCQIPFQKVCPRVSALAKCCSWERRKMQRPTSSV